MKDCKKIYKCVALCDFNLTKGKVKKGVLLRLRLVSTKPCERIINDKMKIHYVIYEFIDVDTNLVLKLADHNNPINQKVIINPLIILNKNDFIGLQKNSK